MRQSQLGQTRSGSDSSFILHIDFYSANQPSASRSRTPTLCLPSVSSVHIPFISASSFFPNGGMRTIRSPTTTFFFRNEYLRRTSQSGVSVFDDLQRLSEPGEAPAEYHEQDRPTNNQPIGDKDPGRVRAQVVQQEPD